jgi:hypothetical protein
MAERELRDDDQPAEMKKRGGKKRAAWQKKWLKGRETRGRGWQFQEEFNERLLKWRGRA